MSPDYMADNNAGTGGYASQLFIRLKPSLIYRKLLLLITSLSLLAIFLSEIHSAFQCSLVLFLALLLKHAWSSNQSLELRGNAQGEWQLHSKQQEQKARLLADSVVTPLFAVLQFRLERAGRKSVVIFRDSLGSDDFRRLRVRLKVEGIQPVQRDTLGG
jgi:hypothetical protein